MLAWPKDYSTFVRLIGWGRVGNRKKYLHMIVHYFLGINFKPVAFNTKKCICRCMSRWLQREEASRAISSFITVGVRIRASQSGHRIRYILSTCRTGKWPNSNRSNSLIQGHGVVQKTGATSLAQIEAKS